MCLELWISLSLLIRRPWTAWQTRELINTRTTPHDLINSLVCWFCRGSLGLQCVSDSDWQFVCLYVDRLINIQWFVRRLCFTLHYHETLFCLESLQLCLAGFERNRCIGWLGVKHQVTYWQQCTDSVQIQTITSGQKLTIGQGKLPVKWVNWVYAGFSGGQLADKINGENASEQQHRGFQCKGSNQHFPHVSVQLGRQGLYLWCNLHWWSSVFVIVLKIACAHIHALSLSFHSSHTQAALHNIHTTHTEAVSYFLLIHNKQTFFLMMIQHGKTLNAGQKQTVRFNNIVTRQCSS